jgi:uncharacterized membrane protein
MKNNETMKGTIRYEVTKFDWSNFLYIIILMLLICYALGYSVYIAATEEVPRPIAENIFLVIAIISIFSNFIFLICAITKCFSKVEKEMKVEFEKWNK